MNKPTINIHISSSYLNGFLLFLLILISADCFSQSKSKNELSQSIKGKLHLDSIWDPVVYLSYIPTFKDMYTMSNEMIIAEAKVDANGHFVFPTESFPQNDNLYRLHVSKKEAPAASLIIGGKEENHMFLIANKKSSIYLESKSDKGIFYDYEINGHRPNKDFKAIYHIVNDDNRTSATSNLKKEFVNKTVYEQLRHIADTSSHPIVSLYALTNSKFESSYLENQKFYEGYLEKWKSEDSTYFKELRAKFPKEDKSILIWVVTTGVTFFILGFIINYYISSKNRKSNKQLKLLSIQERKVYSLLLEGKSNKEISEEFNIGVSTVKSHVSSIYNKLNVKSRKEIVNLK